MPGLKVVIVAGEASGDQHGAKLAAALRELEPDVRISGIGGPALEQAGVDLLFRSEELALVGISEVLGKLKQIKAALKVMKEHLAALKPDLVILIDFPDFNFRVARQAKKLGLRVLYYISPQVWAWRQGRAKTMLKLVDHLAVVFPFEKDFYAQHASDLPVTFVGHPVLDDEAPAHWDQPLPAPADAVWVGLLPGSRHSELRRHMPLLLKTAHLMRQQIPNLCFILPVAPGLTQADMDPYLQEPAPGLIMVYGRTPQVMSQAKVLIAASGTATLQAALAATPTVVVYKTGWINFWLARALIKVRNIAMPNLILGRTVMPELIQYMATPKSVAAAALHLLNDDEDRNKMVADLKDVRRRLGGPGASRQVAQLAVDLMKKGK